MVNNLGGTPGMELYVVAHDAVTACRSKGLEPVRIMLGSFMTSLEMQGVSLSVLPLDGDKLLLERIDSPTTAPAWIVPSTAGPASNGVDPLPPPPMTDTKDTPSTALFTPEAVVAVTAACDALDSAEPQLTAWDQVAGDGDCGITAQRGAVAVKSVAPSLAGKSASAAYGDLADAVAGSMGGTSGALIEIALRAARVHLLKRAEQGCTAVDHGGAFIAGVNAVQQVGGAQRNMRTMLDAMLPAADELRKKEGEEEEEEEGGGPCDWAAATDAAERGAEATMAMEGLAGRSNYINAELLKTVPDPGAKAIALAMRAALSSLSSRPPPC